jgi:polyphosphate kinase
MSQLIEEEAARDDGHITMKMNSLVDARMIELLYQASQAGTRIELIVRGICCLRAGVPGLSDNITVRSIVGRYLEHSRIYRFGARGRTRHYYIGSADLMPRNLDRRVEALIPITDPDLQFRFDEILDVALADNSLAWVLDDGTWTRASGTPPVDAHIAMQDLARARGSAL